MTVFQSFTQRLGLTPRQARYLVVLSNRANCALIAWHNGKATEQNANVTQQRVTDYAKRFNVLTNWDSGLWPVFKKNGQDTYLPD